MPCLPLGRITILHEPRAIVANIMLISVVHYSDYGGGSVQQSALTFESQKPDRKWFAIVILDLAVSLLSFVGY